MAMPWAKAFSPVGAMRWNNSIFMYRPYKGKYYSSSYTALCNCRRYNTTNSLYQYPLSPNPPPSTSKIFIFLSTFIVKLCDKVYFCSNYLTK